MTFSNQKFLIIFCLTILFYSCRKQVLDCSGKCSDVVFEGLIYDKSLDVPLAVNQSVDIVLYHSGNCWLCSPKTIASGKSNSSGHFSITATFDTSLLDDHYLIVSVTAPDNFINTPQPVGPGILNSQDNVSSKMFSTIDAGILKNLRFDFYPKALLKINLHRTSVLVQQYPSLFQSYSFDNHTSVWGLYERASNKDTTLTIYTSANIFTKIVTRTQQSQTMVNTRIDSIKCLINANNSIDITY